MSKRPRKPAQLQLDVQDQGALLSPCGTYRYRLWRRWGRGRSAVFVMANPSTADATADDPTLTRCLGFARSWGLDGVELVNVYAFRATDPTELRAALERGEDVEGPENVHHVLAAARGAHAVKAPIVLAWGASAIPRAREARLLVRRLGACGFGGSLHHLGHTAHGHPRHPLYLPGDTPLAGFYTWSMYARVGLDR